MRRLHLPLTAALLGGWGLYGLFWAAISMRLHDMSPLVAVGLSLWAQVPTVLTTLAVLPLARWLRVVPGRAAEPMALHVALGCAFATAQSALYWQLAVFQPPLPVFGLVAFRYFVCDVIAYLLMAAVVHARDFWHLWHEQQVRAARTRVELARAAVDAVCWRAQPSLILSALDRVDQALCSDPEAAEAALARLGNLLRLLLQEPDRHMASVEHELKVLEAAGGLVAPPGAMTTSVGSDAETATLPRLVLLALVQRTLTDTRCRVRVHAQREGDLLALSVQAEPPLDAAAVGAARERLECAWPARVREDLTGCGVRFLVPAAGV